MRDELKLFAGVALILGIVALGFGAMQGEQGVGPFAQEEELRLEGDLAPVGLDTEETQALRQLGLTLSGGEDASASELLRVQTSDDLSAIEQDLAQTDLSGLTGELTVIDSDLQGM